MVVVLGVIAVVDGMVTRPVEPGTTASVLLVVVGGALVISARRGRARALLLTVPALLPSWVAFAVSDVQLYPGLGDRQDIVVDAEDASRHELGIGDLTIDAAPLALRTRQHATIDAALTAGRLRIYVPYDAVLRLEGSLGLGQVEVWDDRPGAGWRYWDTGPSVARDVERELGALRPLCTDWYVFPEEGEETPFGTVTEPPPQPSTTLPQYRDVDGHSCDPEAVPTGSPVVTVRFEVGAGNVEVHRVEARN
jgi:hypothetical protein